MCLWSVHPQYLDKHGLMALWREGLLAQKALCASAAVSQSNPQLRRFKNNDNPLRAIGTYLSFVAAEGARQGYNLNHEKILYPNFDQEVIPVDASQIAFEAERLKNKLRIRDKLKFKQLSSSRDIAANPIFNIQ